jgi:serine/threonine protein kinase
MDTSRLLITVFVKKICGTAAQLARSAVLPSSWRQRYVSVVHHPLITSDFSRQILLDKKYGRAVDWWAFGVLIYQMLLQQSPFRGEDEDEIYDAILADEPLYPIHMPRDSVSILQKLLTREPELRLGSGPTDAQEIMSHPFFKNINWEDIYHKRVPPPFLPTIKGKADTSNFDSEFTSVTPVLTPVQSVLTQGMQEEFRGFSYTADFV